MPLAGLFVEPLQEGIRDPHVLKAVFLAGAGGSGKGAVADAMFAGWGMKTINQDRHLERFLKDAKVPLKHAGSRYDLLKKAQALKGKELRMYAQRRLGLVIDSTGWDFKRIGDPAKKLRELGYDVYMIFVNTTLKTALRRNKARGKKGGRKVPEAYIETAWEGSQRNLGRFRTLFGKKNLFIVDNDADVPQKTWTSVIAPALRKLGDKIAQRPLRNPVGKKWLLKQATAPDIDDPKKAAEWPAPPEPEPSEIGQYDMVSGWKGSEPPPGGTKHPKSGASKGVAARKRASVTHKGVPAPKLSGTGSVAVKQGGATVSFGKGLIAKIFGGKTKGKKKVRKPAQESLHESPMGTGYWYKRGKALKIPVGGTHDEYVANNLKKFGLKEKDVDGKQTHELTELAIDKGWVRVRITTQESGVMAKGKRDAKMALDWYINKHKMPKVVNVDVRNKVFVSLTTPEEIMAYAWESTNVQTDPVGGGGEGLVLEGSSGPASLTTLFQTRGGVRHGVGQRASGSDDHRRLFVGGGCHHASGGVVIDIESIDEKHWRDNAKDFRNKLQIEPEKAAKDHSVASIGKSAKDKKWYGWSHRAYNGFSKGERKFVTVDWSRTDKTWDELEAEEKTLQAKAPRIKNDTEAKQSAIAYADSVS